MLSPNKVFLAQMITKGPRAMNAVQATARRTLDSPLNPFQPLSDLPHTFSFASPLYAGLGVLRLPLVGACSSYGTACLSFCGMLSSQSLRVRSSLDSSLPHCPFLRLVKVGQREGKRDSRQNRVLPTGSSLVRGHSHESPNSADCNMSRRIMPLPSFAAGGTRRVRPPVWPIQRRPMASIARSTRRQGAIDQPIKTPASGDGSI